MNKFFKFGALIIFLAAFIFLGTTPAQGANDLCRSASGGYCANSAQAVNARKGLEFLQLRNTGRPIEDLLYSLYVFMMGLVAISAVLMTVYGGFLHMTAGDNVGRTKEAWDRIKNAILGLVIALTSYLVLKTINPDLVKINLDLGTSGAQPIVPLRPSSGPENVSSKLPGSVDLGRSCETTSQCMAGLDCNKVPGSPYPGLCVNANRPKAGLGEKEQGELCNPTKDKCVSPLTCKRINPLNNDYYCF